MVTADDGAILLRWIPGLPLLAAMIHGVLLILVRRPLPQWVVWGMSCAAITGSFLLACVAFGLLVQLPADSRLLVDELYTWIGAGIGSRAFSAEVAFALDPLSAVMVLLVTGVGAVVHFYSVAYVAADEREDKGFQRFFAYLSLASFAMLVLVLADNLVLLLLGWQATGLCSMLLVGFWYSDPGKARRGAKSFLMNRIGDAAFLVGGLLLFVALSDAGYPSVSFREIGARMDVLTSVVLTVPAWLPFGPEWSLVGCVASCFTVAACAKSAQFPLHGWLPDAIVGPAPVAALMQTVGAATAGVYLLCRLSFLYAVAPEVSAWVAWVGAVTALLGGLFGLVETDVKRVLAFSTMGQLGLVFVAAGCGAHAAAMYLLVTHAFAKALLFLAAGSVILSMEHVSDLDAMGGLRRRIPRTRWTFLIGCLAIAGIPPLAGFFSRDAMLHAVARAALPGSDWLTAAALVAVFLAGFTVFRLYFRIFRGRSQVPHDVREQIEDPPGSVVIPLYLLAAFALFAGLVGLPQAWGDLLGVDDSNSLQNFLAPLVASAAAPAAAAAEGYRLALGGLAAGIAGVVLAWVFFMWRRDWPGLLRRRLQRTARALDARLWIDRAALLLVVRPSFWFARTVLDRGVERGLIDGLLVGGFARGVRGIASQGLRRLQTGFVQGYLLLMAAGAVAVAAWLLQASR